MVNVFCLLFVAFFDREVFAKMCILVYFFGDDDMYFRGSSSGCRAINWHFTGSSDTCIAINCCSPIQVSVLPVLTKKQYFGWLFYAIKRRYLTKYLRFVVYVGVLLGQLLFNHHLYGMSAFLLQQYFAVLGMLCNSLGGVVAYGY